MVHQSPYPTLKGPFTSKGTDFLKDLQEAVIQNLQGFIFIPRILHTHGHHRMEIPLIQLLLTLSVISYATLYELGFSQNPLIGYY